MKVNDFGKLGFLLAVLIVVAVLAVLDVVEHGLVTTVILVELGYVTGNGVLAKRGQAPSPVLSPKDGQAAGDNAG